MMKLKPYLQFPVLIKAFVYIIVVLLLVALWVATLGSFKLEKSIDDFVWEFLNG